jgi:uncharacterized protein YdaU (DUF1376 family)
MSAAPFMQLYVADYIGDTLHLTTEQHGAYLLLLMAMWRAGGSLPNEEHKLARIAGLSPARWRRVSGDVMVFFNEIDGQITQKRLAAEIEKAKEKSAKRAEAGAKGGIAKSLKDNETAVANAIGLPWHSSEPEPEPEPEPEKEENKNSSSSTLRPREEDGAAAAAFSKLDLEEEPVAFDELAARLAQLWHDQGLEVPAMAHARTWLGEGHSPDTIVATVKAKLATPAGRRAATLVWFDKAIAEAKPQPSAPKKPAPPTIYVRQLDSAWPAYAEAYRTMKGKDPPTDRAGGWHFPIDLLPAHSTH